MSVRLTPSDAMFLYGDALYRQGEHLRAKSIYIGLHQRLAGDKKAELAFKALTPGRRREYADYVSEAKRAATRTKRIEKILPMIAAGTGLNDKYKNC